MIRRPWRVALPLRRGDARAPRKGRRDGRSLGSRPPFRVRPGARSPESGPGRDAVSGVPPSQKMMSLDWRDGVPLRMIVIEPVATFANR